MIYTANFLSQGQTRSSMDKSTRNGGFYYLMNIFVLYVENFHYLVITPYGYLICNTPFNPRPV
jgi:hypothetical protein